jgi:uncharacterized protein
MRYSLHLTTNCNLRCAYCYEDNKIEKDRTSFVISFTEIDQKLQEILSRGNCDELELLGGEIFLYPDRVKYIFENYHKYFPFILTTNGTLRNAGIDNLLARYKPTVGVSLDDPVTVERQRLGLDFAKALANAKFWRQQTEVLITAVITPQNIRRIKETFDFYILEQGFAGIHFGCVEEWMNPYYWSVYQKEALRLIQNTDQSVLRRVICSPWKEYAVSKKEFVFEDGVEKLEIFNPNKMELDDYRKAKHAVYCAYCERLGVKPAPLVPKGVLVVENAK